MQLQKEEETPSFNIELSWEEKDVDDETRIGAMYCFKNCGVNKN